MPAVSRRKIEDRVRRATSCVAAIAALVVVSSETHAAPDPLAALTREVSALRGLRAKRKLVHETVDRAELRRRLLELASDDKTRRDAVAEGLALARWGLIPMATDYVQLRIALLTDQIAGYYDPRTQKLTITKDASGDPKWAELVLAHEIDHALQDQAFDLKKLTDVAPSEGDAALARHALIEGDGIALMIELALSRQNVDPPWANPAIAADVVRAMAGPTGDSLDKAPLAVRETLLFAYREGFAFVAALLQREGWTTVDAALRNPPRSTEQILHPEKYATNEKPVVVRLAAPAHLAGYAVAHSTVWGELGFALFLRSHGIPVETAAVAAAGWGGDRVLTLARDTDVEPEHAIGLARLEWDSEADAIEAYAMTARALDAAQTGATVDHDDVRTRWFGVDGKVTTLERNGTAIDIAIGVPVYLYIANK